MTINFHWMHRFGFYNGDEQGLVQMAQDMEKANITSVLLPYGYRGIDFSLYLFPMLKATKKIKMMLALPAYGVMPEFAAKTFKTVNNFAGPRIDLNLVAGKFEGDKEQSVIDAYPGDISLIDEHDKRVALTAPWMDKFVDLMHETGFESTLCVVGSSDITIGIANKHGDYIIVGEYMLNPHVLNKITNTKLMLIIDPLILKEGQDPSSVEYVQYQYTLTPNHTIKGTKEEVVNQINKISEEFGINDFMIVTDQKDISGILAVIKELTEQNKN